MCSSLYLWIVVCLFLKCALGDCSPISDKDYYGGDIARVGGIASFATCCDMCINNPNCVCFTYASATQLCYLKGSKGNLVDSPGAVSGLKSDGGHPPISGASGTDELGGGTIFLIIFFCVTISYFIFGMAYNRIKNEATGSDMIPQKEFWSDFGGLVKDGILFTVARVKGNV